MKALAMSETDQSAMLSALPYPYNLLFLLGTKTGLRISELLSLKMSDLYNDQCQVTKTLYVSKQHVKGKKMSRYIPLNDKTRSEIMSLARISKRDDLLFPLSRLTVYRTFERTRKCLGIETRLATHGMRKTFAKKVYELSGRNLILTQKSLGHSSINSTIRYLEVDIDELNSVMALI